MKSTFQTCFRNFQLRRSPRRSVSYFLSVRTPNEFVIRIVNYYINSYIRIYAHEFSLRFPFFWFYLCKWNFQFADSERNAVFSSYVYDDIFQIIFPFFFFLFIRFDSFVCILCLFFVVRDDFLKNNSSDGYAYSSYKLVSFSVYF